MRSSVFVAGAVLWCVALGCSSDDSDAEGSGGKAGSSSAGSKATSAGSASGGSKANGSAGSKANGSAGSKANGSAGSAGSSGSAMSPECQKYCDCHDKNCASSPIPDGKSCADFCAGFSDEQMECRQVHCILAPEQPDNDHCTHSLGIIQCL